jgi:hypothetical protein
MFEDVAPERRKSGWFHGTIEQGRVADRRLEILDSPGRSRLREIEPQRGTIHRARFGDSNESLDILQVHERGA